MSLTSSRQSTFTTNLRRKRRKSHWPIVLIETIPPRIEIQGMSNNIFHPRIGRKKEWD